MRFGGMSMLLVARKSEVQIFCVKATKIADIEYPESEVSQGTRNKPSPLVQWMIQLEELSP